MHPYKKSVYVYNIINKYECIDNNIIYYNPKGYNMLLYENE